MTVLTIAGVELVRILRDRVALFFMVLLPFLIIFLVGITFYGDDDLVPVGVVYPEEDPLASELFDSLGEGRGLDLTTYDDAESASTGLRRGREAAIVLIGDDHAEAVTSGQGAVVTLLTRVGSIGAGVVRPILAQAVSEQFLVNDAAQLASQAASVPYEAALSRARELAPNATVSVRVDSVEGSGSDVLDDIDTAGTFGFSGPQNLVLFVFLNSLAGSAGLIETRRLGVWRRMVATPNRLSTLVWGQVAGRLAIALSQSALILVLGSVLFGIDWGDPLAAGALVAMFALVGAGAGLLVGGLARTSEQATSIGPPIAIALGMLGGCMWPLEIVPEVMQTAGHVVPHAWAMDGWSSVVVSHAGLSAITTELLVLAAFAAVFLVAGARLLRGRT